MNETLNLLLTSEAEQEAFGSRLARASSAPLLIYLDGDLGAGKTTLARGFLRGLGHQGSVKSPTYTLIEPYATAAMPVYHLDLYRLSDPGELEYLGLREMLAEHAVLLIEWPQRGRGWLPSADLQIEIEVVPQGRRLNLRANGARGEAVVERLSEYLE